MADDVLRRLGAAAINRLPLKEQQAMRGVTFRSEAGPTQSIASGSQSGNLAGVIPGQNVINVMDPAAFQKAPEQLAAHEGMHIWQNNLPPTLAAKIPADNPQDPYGFGGVAGLNALRQRGGTILDLPKEQQAAMMQYRQSQGGDQAPQAIRKATDPFIQDMNNLPLSTIMPTDPQQKGINTKPRAPLPPMMMSQQIYAKGQAPDTPPPPPGFEPVQSSAIPPPPSGFEPLPDGLEDYPVTQTGAKTFAGPTVYPQQSILTDLGNLGKGVAKGAGSTLFNLGKVGTPLSFMGGGEPKPDALTPQGFAQNVGYGGEQAAEFFAPAAAEGKLAAAASDALPFLGKTLPKIGAQALTSGAVTKAQGGDFSTGAIAGGVAGAFGRAAEAAAPTMAESALGVRNVDRNFSKTPGKAILNDTKGFRPRTVADSAESKIGQLTGELEDRAANTPIYGTTAPAVGVVDKAIAKKAGQNSPVVDDLQTLRDQLTVNRSTKAPIPSDQSATGILNLKRGVGDTVGRWPIEQQKGVKGVAKQVYGALDSELDRTVPGADALNQRISSLIPVGNRANAADLNANLMQRSLGRFGRHTGALATAGIGSAMGARDGGGTKGAIEGGLLGLFGPEFIANPTTQMIGARALDAFGQPIARYAGGAASQLFRPQNKQ